MTAGAKHRAVRKLRIARRANHGRGKFYYDRLQRKHITPAVALFPVHLAIPLALTLRPRDERKLSRSVDPDSRLGRQYHVREAPCQFRQVRSDSCRSRGVIPDLRHTSLCVLLGDQ